MEVQVSAEVSVSVCTSPDDSGRCHIRLHSEPVFYLEESEKAVDRPGQDQQTEGKLHPPGHQEAELSPSSASVF